MKRRVFAVFFLMVGWTMGALELDLPFTDHAVFQARKVLPVWGKAVPGSEVWVKLGVREKNTTASAEGLWQVEFEATEAAGVAVTLEVVAGEGRFVSLTAGCDPFGSANPPPCSGGGIVLEFQFRIASGAGGAVI
ncbi:MAG: hypothetical protein ACJAXZ_000705 [Akkermansiaceae bacterium]|jgi:hypothetical protein